MSSKAGREKGSAKGRGQRDEWDRRKLQRDFTT
jgi:hypothetical protein